MQAKRYAAEGYTVVLIGHAGHEEVVGTMGEIPDSIVLVESKEQVAALDLPADTKLAYVTQTTLSVDETGEVITALRERFPAIRAPQREDICYATSNRQWAVKELLDQIDLLLVIGSRNSSNSNRLVETARAGGVPSYLIDDETEIDEAWIDDEHDGRRHHLGRLGAGEARAAASAPGSASAASRTSRSTASSRRTSSSACRSSCAASSRSPIRSRGSAGRRPASGLLEPKLGAELDRDGERLLGDPVGEREQILVGDPEADPVGDLEARPPCASPEPRGSGR